MPITQERFLAAMRATREIYEYGRRMQQMARDNRANNSTIEEAYRIARDDGDETTVPRRAFAVLDQAYEAFVAMLAYEEPPLDAIVTIAAEMKYFEKNWNKNVSAAARQRKHRAIMRGPDHIDGRRGTMGVADADPDADEWTDPDDADAELVTLRKANPELTREEIHALRERERQQRADDAADAGDMFGGNGPRSEPRN